MSLTETVMTNVKKKNNYEELTDLLLNNYG